MLIGVIVVVFKFTKQVVIVLLVLIRVCLGYQKIDYKI